MRDPEMCFELGFAEGPHLEPFYFRNDYLGIEQWSRTIERGHSLPGLPFYLRSACRAQDTHALRTHALVPRIAARLSKGVRTPAPRQAGVPFRRFYPVAEGGEFFDENPGTAKASG